MKKILFISDFPTRTSGYGIQIKYLFEYFYKKNYKLSIICMCSNPKHRDEPYKYKDIEKKKYNK